MVGLVGRLGCAGQAGHTGVIGLVGFVDGARDGRDVWDAAAWRVCVCVYGQRVCLWRVCVSALCACVRMRYSSWVVGNLLRVARCARRAHGRAERLHAVVSRAYVLGRSVGAALLRAIKPAVISVCRWRWLVKRKKGALER